MNLKKNNLFESARQIIVEARQQVYRATNTALIKMYWEIGKLIIEEEQQGKRRAQYGKAVLEELSKQLATEFGKGFDFTNLSNMRKFYLAFPILDAVRQELSWTHYRILSRLENERIRHQYMLESITGNWNTRTLQRNIDSHYLGRLLEVPKQTELPITSQQFIKDPYIFEFLGIPADVRISEKELESTLITHIQNFLMELGKGFAFVARQQHIVTDTDDFFIDLVFYNYYLKCFVLIDLKTKKLTHKDIGQMDMYVRMYNDLKKSDNDNLAIGIILCTEKDETIIKYSVLSENKNLFASKYRLYLPNEEELKQLIEQGRTLYELSKKEKIESE